MTSPWYCNRAEHSQHKVFRRCQTFVAARTPLVVDSGVARNCRPVHSPYQIGADPRLWSSSCVFAETGDNPSQSLCYSENRGPILNHRSWSSPTTPVEIQASSELEASWRRLSVVKRALIEKTNVSDYTKLLYSIRQERNSTLRTIATAHWFQTHWCQGMAEIQIALELN